MKSLLVALSLALAALAFVPPSSAALGAPCETNASNDTACHAEVAGCYVDTYMYDVEDALNHYRAGCAGCVYYDNYGRPALRITCIATDEILATGTATAEPDLSPCTAGFAQTWCDATVGPCDVRVTPWTAWGDVYAWADCDGSNMNRCYAEVHTQDPLAPEQWCAF